MNLEVVTPYLISAAVAIIATAISLFLSFRYGLGTSLPDTQSKVIIALNEQIKVLEGKVAGQKDSLEEMHYVLLTIQEALKRRGIVIDVHNGESIVMTDTIVPVEHIIKIKRDDEAK